MKCMVKCGECDGILKGIPLLGRQREIIVLMRARVPQGEIAKRLKLSVRTVRSDLAAALDVIGEHVAK